MDELDINDFKYGGVNITGFVIINTSSARYQTAQRYWTRRNPNYWLGDRRRLTVSHLKLIRRRRRRRDFILLNK